MAFPIFPFAPKIAAAIPVEVQRLGADSPIRRVPPHGHLFFELLLVTAGSGMIMVDGTTHAALPGSVFVIAPGMPHDARGLGKASGWALMFTAEGVNMSPAPGLALLEDAPAGLVFDPFRRAAKQAGAPISLASVETAEIEQMLERIEAELASRSPGYEVAVRAAVNLVMVQLGRSAPAHDCIAPDAAVQGRALLVRVFEDIDRHFQADPSLVSAARRLGMAPAHLTTRIRRLTGRTYGDWIIERRMIEARHRLVTTPQSLAEIAAAVGYSDTESFIRRFRAHHGATPAQWRARAQAEDTDASVS